MGWSFVRWQIRTLPLRTISAATTCFTPGTRGDEEF
jgi:hypothetical protein